MRVYLFVSAAIAVFTFSCSGAQTPEACYAPKLAEINARASMELAAACVEYPDVESCPFAEAIDARYDKQADDAREGCL